MFKRVREGGNVWDCSGWMKMCLSSQLGDGSADQQQRTPVAVAGLSSGVAMVALGSVRLPAPASQLMLVCESGHCVFD